MRRFLLSRDVVLPVVLAVILAFAFFMLASSGQLYAAAMGSADGPLNGQQVASLRLSNVLDVTGAALISGTFLVGISYLFNRRNSNGTTVCHS